MSDIPNTTLNEEQRTKFEWLTDQGHKIAVMLNSRATAPLGLSLAGILLNEYNAIFAVQNAVNAKAAAARQTAAKALMVNDGPKLWKVIHKRALAFTGTPVEIEAETGWIRAFAGNIPCGECKAFYVKWTGDNPAPLSNPDPTAYFRWTVNLHNAVNAKSDVDKPQMDYGAAEIYWRQQ